MLSSAGTAQTHVHNWPTAIRTGRRPHCADAARDRRPSHPERHHEARRLRHATYPLLADRSQPRHRRRARLDLRPVPGLRGRVGRAHDGRQAELRPAAGRAQSRAGDGHEPRRHAARHAARVGRPRLRGQRPLRLALHRRPELHLRRPGRRRRRLGRGRRARARAGHGQAPVRRHDRLHGGRGRGAGPLRLDLLRPQAKAPGMDVEGMFTNDIVGSSTSDKGRRDPFTVRLFSEGVPTTETPRRPRCASRSAARTTGPRASSRATSRRSARTRPPGCTCA